MGEEMMSRTTWSTRRNQTPPRGGEKGGPVTCGTHRPDSSFARIKTFGSWGKNIHRFHLQLIMNSVHKPTKKTWVCCLISNRVWIGKIENDAVFVFFL